MGKEETRAERGGDAGERREMIGKELGSHGKRRERQGERRSMRKKEVREEIGGDDGKRERGRRGGREGRKGREERERRGGRRGPISAECRGFFLLLPGIFLNFVRLWALRSGNGPSGIPATRRK